jgi:hypothetical protein
MITNLTTPIRCTNCTTPPIKSFIWHGGNLLGLTTYLMIFPEQNFVVSLLANIGYPLGLDLVAISIAKNFML